VETTKRNPVVNVDPMPTFAMVNVNGDMGNVWKEQEVSTTV